MLGIESKERARQILETNWTGRYTRPSPNHYPPQFRWDSDIHVEINALLGNPQRAETELTTLLSGMNKNGFIPNRRIPGKNASWNDLESFTFIDRKNGSSYTQPPLEAQAAWITYESLVAKGENGKKFLKNIYGNTEEEKVSGLRGAYEYFRRYRQNGNESSLVGVIHPNETGRDSDPSLKPGAIRIPGVKGIVPLANTALDFITTARINTRAKLRKWNPEKMKKEVYWVNDVMFNTLYVDNLLSMSKISNELERPADAEAYDKLANEVESEILEKMWNEDDGFFYNLDKNGDQISIASISGLFPITLKNIPEHQLTCLLEKMEDKEWFNTPYPIPSLPTHSPFYDPSYKEKRLWRGPTWIITNYMIAKGLAMQLDRFPKGSELHTKIFNLLNNLINKTEELVEKSGFREFFNSETGEGYRVDNFTWPILALLIRQQMVLFRRTQEKVA